LGVGSVLVVWGGRGRGRGEGEKGDIVRYPVILDVTQA
jgi:hypothetical protein